MASPCIRSNDQLHFLLVPLMSQSHLIPFTNLARKLALKGVSVTVILTPINAARYSALLDLSKAYNIKIQFLSFPFPAKDAGLPENCENLESLPSPNFSPNFFTASNLLQQPVENWLEGLESKPSCIVADYCLPWTEHVARRFTVPRIIFHGISCFTLLTSYSIKQSKVLETVTSETEPFLVPGLPDKIEFTKSQLPDSVSRRSDQGHLSNLLDRCRAAELTADGTVVNSFQELEPKYVDSYGKLVNMIWCVGPVTLSNKSAVTMGLRDRHEHECLTWLNTQKPSSVIYACFGSLSHVSTEQLIELGLGLEASNRPFMWIIRAGDSAADQLEKWFVEENFEERIKGRGFVYRGWAPQVLILPHPAVGGFITHCGWNSTLEGISAGVPFVTWPMFAEQFYNEKFIVDVVRTGVRIGVEKCSKWGEEVETGVLVNREEVEKAVEKLMGGGNGREDMMMRARDLKEAAERAAAEVGGSSDLNLSLMIDYIKEKVMSQQIYNEVSDEDVT